MSQGVVGPIGRSKIILRDVSRPLPLVADSVEKVENTAKTKFSQKLAGGRLLLRMRSSREERSPKVDVVHRVWPR